MQPFLRDPKVAVKLSVLDRLIERGREDAERNRREERWREEAERALGSPVDADASGAHLEPPASPEQTAEQDVARLRLREQERAFQESQRKRASDKEVFYQALRRDLEWLFNTRAPVEAPPTKALEDSLYNFGLPDVAALNLTSVLRRTDLARMMEKVINRFEPRLADVKVTAVSAPAGGMPQLHFTIEATLMLDPVPEQVQFDALLKVSEAQYQVRGSDGG